MRWTPLFLAVLLAPAAGARAFPRADVPPSFRSYQAHLAAAEKSLRLNQSRELRRWLDAADPLQPGGEPVTLRERDSVVDRERSRRGSLPGAHLARILDATLE